MILFSVPGLLSLLTKETGIDLVLGALSITIITVSQRCAKAIFREKDQDNPPSQRTSAIVVCLALGGQSIGVGEPKGSFFYQSSPRNGEGPCIRGLSVTREKSRGREDMRSFW